jgi:hypothetical protein
MDIKLTLNSDEAQDLLAALLVAEANNVANVGRGTPGTALRQTQEHQAVALPALIEKLLAAWATANSSQHTR